MPSLLTLDDVAARTPDGRPLFEGLTFALGRERVGLVGRNGVGKSTLLRLILGEASPASGSIVASGRIGFLRQSFQPPPTSRLADLLGVGPALALLDRVQSGQGSDDDFEAADWTLPQRIDEALARIGLDGVSLGHPAAALSGGQLTRAALAALLLGEPDLILLDEPTNNLDAEGRAAVRDLLDDWSGGALVVSHDRSLLRRVDRILELTTLGARVFGGAFDLYAARRAEEEAAAARVLETARREAVRVERSIQAMRERKDRSDAAGRRARLKNDAPKMLLDAKAQGAEATGARQNRLAERQREAARQDLEAAQARVERVRRLAFALPPSNLAAGKLALAFEDVTFAWPGTSPMFRHLTFRVIGPERIAVMGRNGAGKSTLIRLAVGEAAPSEGVVVRGAPSVLLDQHAALLRDHETLLENFRRLNPAAGDNAAYAALARFLFRNSAAERLAAELSGGERLRAALACVLMGPLPPQLLILDEPTNHLDLDSIEAVEAALGAYDGAMLVVSHDEEFLEAIGIRRRLHIGDRVEEVFSSAGEAS
ncbi:MAG TPA: ABC-F family ATP-binding cassette domain-containing protein [Caulobacteraceae bacterium]|jgi:ATPase subunit of ABC transporter with duplicated ATPase domains